MVNLLAKIDPWQSEGAAVDGETWGGKDFERRFDRHMQVTSYFIFFCSIIFHVIASFPLG